MTLFYLINEDGVVYARCATLLSATAWLEQFPNDTIAIAIAGSPTAEWMRWASMRVMTPPL
jgi:hypothetical protein